MSVETTVATGAPSRRRRTAYTRTTSPPRKGASTLAPTPARYAHVTGRSGTGLPGSAARRIPHHTQDRRSRLATCRPRAIASGHGRVSPRRSPNAASASPNRVTESSITRMMRHSPVRTGQAPLGRQLVRLVTAPQPQPELRGRDRCADVEALGDVAAEARQAPLDRRRLDA